MGAGCGGDEGELPIALPAIFLRSIRPLECGGLTGWIVNLDGGAVVFGGKTHRLHRSFPSLLTGVVNYDNMRHEP